MIALIRRWGELVTFSHTIFMMPFAAAAVVLALAVPHESLTPVRILAMLGCMVTARTSAMAFNRWADRDVDAKNPRTKGRPVAAGRISPREALTLTVVASAAFCGFAVMLGFWPAVLAAPVLVVLHGYSFAKRFTWLAHAWLGFALALAPGGAWVGMGAAPNLGIVALMASTLTWLLGFDVLYALQDEAFDWQHGLFSIPARFGVRFSFRIAVSSHVLTVMMLATAGALLHRGPVFFVGVVAVAVVLVVEHRLVRTADGSANLAKIPKAFFDCNAYVSMGFFVTTAIDALLG